MARRRNGFFHESGKGARPMRARHCYHKTVSKGIILATFLYGTVLLAVWVGNPSP